MLKLGTIEEEAAACRKRFEGVKVGTPVVHCHHEIPIEILIESADNRISYILSDKKKEEQALRLRLFAPAIIPAKLQEAYAKWQEADAKWMEADAKWEEAYAKWREAYAKWQEADAKWQEAYAKWQEAYAKWKEADAKWQEANAKWREAVSMIPHSEICPLGSDCPWDGKTIFAGEFAN